MPAIVDHGPPTRARPSGAISAVRISQRSRPLRDAVAPEQRRERRVEAHEAARERDALQELRRLRHRALAERAVDAGERPVALADDHDAVRARHAAEPRQRGARVGLDERTRRVVHARVVAHEGPPREGGTAQSLRVGPSGVYQTPREKKPSSARTRMTIRMIQRIPIVDVPLSSTTGVQRPRGRCGYGQRQQPLDRRIDAVAVAQLDELGRGRARRAAATARARRAASRSSPCARRRRTPSRRRGSPRSRARAARSASVTRSAWRPSSRPCRSRPSFSRVAICAASSWWQHGATTIASAPSRTPAAIASSVAVSHAWSETSRSIGSSLA